MTTTKNGEPYHLRAKGWRGLFINLFTGKVFGAPRPLLIIDSAGIHWPGLDAKQEFVLAWDEIREVVRQRFWGTWYYFVLTKDVDAALARHPLQALGKMSKQFGPSPFSIPAQYAPLDEIATQVHRFSTIPVHDASVRK